jgi:hypothetical protein
MHQLEGAVQKHVNPTAEHGRHQIQAIEEEAAVLVKSCL